MKRLIVVTTLVLAVAVLLVFGCSNVPVGPVNDSKLLIDYKIVGYVYQALNGRPYPGLVCTALCVTHNNFVGSYGISLSDGSFECGGGSGDPLQYHNGDTFKVVFNTQGGDYVGCSNNFTYNAPQTVAPDTYL